MLNKRNLILGLILILLMSFCVWFYNRVVYDAPYLPDSVVEMPQVKKIAEDYYTLGSNWLRKNKHGNWESYIEGSSYERGRVIGLLHSHLVTRQEEVFVAEIERNLPNWFFRKAILLGVAWFNRDLDKSIPIEYQKEIYGISEDFSDDYDYIGPKYNRILNYHAAHDIGHAVQNMRLVGCTAFGAWQFNDSTSEMIVGRNFDFYFGDDFAKEKIVLFVNPDEGYKYMSVTWGGFCGVVSGMNEYGLGITLNSDKSEVPTQSATPVSIVAREMLQYAKNIEEATMIANKYQTFVSESFTISSAEDKMVVVIEKTPKSLGIYKPVDNSIVVTNHFQSPKLKDLAINTEHIRDSESMDRYMRTDELLAEINDYAPSSIAKILRDQSGIEGANIGTSNPKAINQLLAHHAVIFKNMERQVWVSNYPFQENVFNAYDLDNFEAWGSGNVTFPISIDSLEIAADTYYLSSEYEVFEKFKKLKTEIIEATHNADKIDEESLLNFVSTNPEYYETYRYLGDYYYANEQMEAAKESYQMALTKNIAYMADKEYIENRILEIEE